MQRCTGFGTIPKLPTPSPLDGENVERVRHFKKTRAQAFTASFGGQFVNERCTGLSLKTKV
jgi:hypothetical protein